nr:DUF1080 domain-containing protein [uncultured Pedobacter sp.]
MRFAIFSSIICLALLLSFLSGCQLSNKNISGKHFTSLFDGKTFNGWQGDTIKTWQIKDGAITGGSLSQEVPENDFLVTSNSYSDFKLRLKFKLTGNHGFVNAGVQFRSQRLTNPPNEMKGYQGDIGPGYWASLYDESRRNITLAMPDSALIAKSLKPDDWNDFEILAEGSRIRIFLNGHQTIDYKETDPNIPESGFIGLQIHGGGKAIVSYKDILIQKLNLK